MSKITRLTKQINRLAKRIEICEEKIAKALELVDAKKITKAEYQEIKRRYSTKARGLRGAIRRKEKARLYHERKLKKKREAREKKRAERERKRAAKKKEKG
jgi:hypothetical protein